NTKGEKKVAEKVEVEGKPGGGKGVGGCPEGNKEKIGPERVRKVRQRSMANTKKGMRRKGERKKKEKKKKNNGGGEEEN
ncbi:hypothetical protein, partial [Escherichia coli]|uniref:hypothetical protein n=1 Tax=Escherichia coli TaxID=562 RepID=UPI001103E7B4